MPDVSAPALCALDVQWPSAAVRVPPGWYSDEVGLVLADVAIMHCW